MHKVTPDLSKTESAMLKKPSEMTREGFAKLLNEAIAERDYQGREGPIKDAARECGVSADTTGHILRSEFPKKFSGEVTATHKRKVEIGATSTLTRICDTFGFDLDIALEVFHLPKDEFLIGNVRREMLTRASGLLLYESDLDMLRKQVDIIGPIPLMLVPELVRLFRREGNTPK